MTISLSLATVAFWTKVKIGTLIISIIGCILAAFGVLMLIKSYHAVFFILNPNLIKVLEKAWCGGKLTVYERGQITEIHFNSSINPGDNGEDLYIYEIKILQNIPGKGPEYVVFTGRYKKILYTEEEIGYFNYVMNHHIQTNMNMQNMN